MSTYPPALRNVLKAVPAIVLGFGFTYITWMYLHGLTRHSQDHVPKFSYKYDDITT